MDKKENGRLNHRIKPMRAQIDEIERLGRKELAKELRRIANRLEWGYIKTVTQLDLELNEAIKKFKK